LPKTVSLWSTGRPPQSGESPFARSTPAPPGGSTGKHRQAPASTGKHRSSTMILLPESWRTARADHQSPKAEPNARQVHERKVGIPCCFQQRTATAPHLCSTATHSTRNALQTRTPKHGRDHQPRESVL
jgi:hypothetical protein